MCDKKCKCEKDGCEKFYLKLADIERPTLEAIGTITVDELEVPVELSVGVVEVPGESEIKTTQLSCVLYSDKLCLKPVGRALFNETSITNGSIENFNNSYSITGTFFIDSRKCNSTVSLTFGNTFEELQIGKKYKTQTVMGTGLYNKQNNLTFKRYGTVVSVSIC